MSEDRMVPCPRCEGAGKIPLKSRGSRPVKLSNGDVIRKARYLRISEGCNVCNGGGRVPERHAVLWLQTMRQGDYL